MFEYQTTGTHFISSAEVLLVNAREDVRFRVGVGRRSSVGGALGFLVVVAGRLRVVRVQAPVGRRSAT